MIEDDDDRKRVVPDGQSVRVPLMMCDSTQRAIAEAQTPRGRYVERLTDAHRDPLASFNPPAPQVLAPDTFARQRWVRDLETGYLNRPPAWPIGALIAALQPEMASGRIREEGEPDPSEALDSGMSPRDRYVARLQTAHKGNAA